MSDKGITWEQYNRGGYAKKGLKKEYIDEVHSRTLAPDGRTVVHGEAGRQLRDQKLAMQRYYEGVK